MACNGSRTVARWGLEVFGYMHIFEWEWGYVLLSELQEVKLPFGLGIERDLHLADDVTVRNCILK